MVNVDSLADPFLFLIICPLDAWKSTEISDMMFWCRTIFIMLCLYENLSLLSCIRHAARFFDPAVDPFRFLKIKKATFKHRHCVCLSVLGFDSRLTTEHLFSCCSINLAHLCNDRFHWHCVPWPSPCWWCWECVHVILITQQSLYVSVQNQVTVLTDIFFYLCMYSKWMAMCQLWFC